MKSNINLIHSLGQSIWLDFIDRAIMQSGKLHKLIEEDGIRGVTSNPAIFEQAISHSSDYDEDIRRFSKEESDSEEIFFRLAVSDIGTAADLFRPLYEQGEVEGADGYVSLEVAPRLAHDSQGTVEQAMHLWKTLRRENAMIKIPGTKECLPAIRQCIAEGVNINVTLLFGLQQYEAVADAYIAGLEDRMAAGHPLDRIASVASFFISRIDVMVDPLLDAAGLQHHKGEVAVSLAKQAYVKYKELFGSDRFKRLQEKGAKPQRLLWASTGVKDEHYKDTKYVESLIGPDTVNTIPLPTLEAVQDHGEIRATLEEGEEQAAALIGELGKAGLNLDQIADKLQTEGVSKFTKPFQSLMDAIEKQRAEMHV